MGRLGPSAEKHARDFEALLGRLENGEAVETGAPTPDDPGEIEDLRGAISSWSQNKAPYSCPSACSDEELMAALQQAEED